MNKFPVEVGQVIRVEHAEVPTVWYIMQVTVSDDERIGGILLIDSRDKGTRMGAQLSFWFPQFYNVEVLG